MQLLLIKKIKTAIHFPFLKMLEKISNFRMNFTTVKLQEKNKY